ncbi:hypothetical protein FOA52_008408 [Chlamydomonas sp. UWO 241]|nr:hypothetical protein FOA52_008408 [Chlamydomonas sp. UWO 241]
MIKSLVVAAAADCGQAGAVALGGGAVYAPTIANGDLVIAYETPLSMKAVTVDVKSRYDNRFGSFVMKDWVGLPFGSKVHGKEGKGWLHLLVPTPELWTLVLKHRTQILYIADISMVCLNLELKPGSIVLESGTGSASLTHSLGRCVAPHGRVHSYEFHLERSDEARKELIASGLGSVCDVTHRDIMKGGFPLERHEGRADAVFLDLPGPHEVVANAAACLRPNGRFCSFSPCIEQIQRTAEQLAKNGFTDIGMIEVLLREYDVHTEKLAVVTDEVLARSLAPQQHGGGGGAGRQQQQRGGAPNRHGAGSKGGKADAAAAQEDAGEGGEADAAAGEGATVDAAMEEAEAGAAVEAAAEPAEAAGGGAVEGAPGGAGEAGGSGGGGCVEVEGAPAAASAAAAAADGAAAGYGERGVKRKKTAEGGGGSGGLSAAAAAGVAAALATIAAARAAAASGAVAAPAWAAPVESAVTSRPHVDAKGHTGYLLFARKFV